MLPRDQQEEEEGGSGGGGEYQYHGDCAAVHPTEPYHRRARFELHKYVMRLSFEEGASVACAGGADPLSNNPVLQLCVCLTR